MARGNDAKEIVIKKIAETFGTDYLGLYDKKIYVQAKEGGEMVQIAISLTCPKVPVQFSAAAANDDGDWDFSDTPKAPVVSAVQAPPVPEITEEEKQNLADLMARLGL